MTGRVTRGQSGMRHAGWHRDSSRQAGRALRARGRAGGHLGEAGGSRAGQAPRPGAAPPGAPRVTAPSPQAVGISVEFVSHLTCAFALSTQPGRAARAADALVTMGSKVGTAGGGQRPRGGPGDPATLTLSPRRWWPGWP